MNPSGGSDAPERSTSRDRQRLDTRERVYQAALSEFARVGVAQTQIERIVELAGVSVGTFYRYFPGRDAVLLELEQRLVRDAVRIFQERLGGASSLRDLLHLVAEAVLSEPTGDTFNLHREAVALIVRTPWPPLDWLENPIFGPVTAAISRAQASGEIRGDLAPEKLTQVIATSLFGFAASLDAPSSARVEDARLMLDMVLQGVRTK